MIKGIGMTVFILMTMGFALSVFVALLFTNELSANARRVEMQDTTDLA